MNKKLTTEEFMVGFYLARYIYPEYGLTAEETAIVRESVAETMLGLTPYKNWLDAAQKTCKMIKQMKKEEDEEKEEE